MTHVREERTLGLVGALSGVFRGAKFGRSRRDEKLEALLVLAQLLRGEFLLRHIDGHADDSFGSFRVGGLQRRRAVHVAHGAVETHVAEIRFRVGRRAVRDCVDEFDEPWQVFGMHARSPRFSSRSAEVARRSKAIEIEPRGVDFEATARGVELPDVDSTRAAPGRAGAGRGDARRVPFALRVRCADDP